MFVSIIGAAARRSGDPGLRDPGAVDRGRGRDGGTDRAGRRRHGHGPKGVVPGRPFQRSFHLHHRRADDKEYQAKPGACDIPPKKTYKKPGLDPTIGSETQNEVIFFDVTLSSRHQFQC